MATRSSRCSRSYHRLKSGSSEGSTSIEVSSIPFPASGISKPSLSCNFRSEIGDRPHHGVHDAGIIERMARALDDANLGVGPARGQRLRGRRRTQQVVTALHDDAGDALELSGFRQKLVRLHEAVVLEIMRFHEGR